MDLELYKQPIFMLAIVAGQIITVYLPYRKVRKEKGLVFDKNYLYSAIGSYVAMGAAVLGTPMIMALPVTGATVLTLMFGSGLIQQQINKMVPKGPAYIILDK
jgi:hypothetical protein